MNTKYAVTLTLRELKCLNTNTEVVFHNSSGRNGCSRAASYIKIVKMSVNFSYLVIVILTKEIYIYILTACKKFYFEYDNCHGIQRSIYSLLVILKDDFSVRII